MAIRISGEFTIEGGKGGQVGLETAMASHNDLIASSNINPVEGVWRKRPGVAKGDQGILTGTYPVGIYWFLAKDGTEYCLVSSQDGSLCKTNVGAAPTSLQATTTSGRRLVSFAELQNEVYVADGVNPLLVFTPPSTAVQLLTNIPTAWSTDKPVQIVHHRNRLWTFIKNSNILYGSELLDGKKWTGATSVVITAGSGSAIAGLVEFLGQLFVFMESGLVYLLDDPEASVANWRLTAIFGEKVGPAPVTWASIVALPSDIYFMDSFGRVYSVSKMNQFGDYEEAEVTIDPRSGNYFGKWIAGNTTIDAAKVFGFYLPTQQVLVYFVQDKVSATNIALVYIPNIGRWVIWKGHKSYSSTGLAYRVSNGIVYGVNSSDDFVYEFTRADAKVRDEAAGISANLRSIFSVLGTPGKRKRIGRVRVFSDVAVATLSYIVYVDKQSFSGSIALEGKSGTGWGTHKWGTHAWGGLQPATALIPVGAIGSQLSIELTNNTVDEDLGITFMVVDYKLVGRQQTGVSAT